jgi:hypothetical protein
MPTKSFAEDFKQARLQNFLKCQAMKSNLRNFFITKENLKFERDFLVKQKLLLPHQSAITDTPGLETQHLFIISQYQYLKDYSLIASASIFMNEGFYILNPTQTDSSYVTKLIPRSFEHKNLVMIIFYKDE